jgi:hypothetical protein
VADAIARLKKKTRAERTAKAAVVSGPTHPGGSKRGEALARNRDLSGRAKLMCNTKGLFRWGQDRSGVPSVNEAAVRGKHDLQDN